MKAERARRLLETFRLAWGRDFPGSSLPGLWEGVDDPQTILAWVSDSERDSRILTEIISATRDRLATGDRALDSLLQCVHKELLVKEFLIRFLEILTSEKEFSSRLVSLVVHQLLQVGEWRRQLNAAVVSNVNKPVQLNTAIVSSEDKPVQSNVTVVNKVDRPVEGLNRLACRTETCDCRYCAYLNEKKATDNYYHTYTASGSKKTYSRRDKYDENVYDNNITVSSLTSEDMFHRRKNSTTTKSKETDNGSYILGSKDNFLAVKSKHIAPAVTIYKTDSANSNSNPHHLQKNFQMLKLTDGFDLVLGDSTGSGCHNNNPGQRDNVNTDEPRTAIKGQLSPRNPQSKGIPAINKPHESSPLREDAATITPTMGTYRNISTIQIRQPVQRTAPPATVTAPTTPVVDSGVTQGKQTPVNLGSSSVVSRTTAGPADYYSNTSDRSQVNNPAVVTVSDTFVNDCSPSHDVQANSVSFKSNLGKFTNKPVVVPPPVAKKPSRTGSSSSINKLPLSEGGNTVIFTNTITTTQFALPVSVSCDRLLDKTGQESVSFGDRNSRVVCARSLSTGEVCSRNTDSLCNNNVLRTGGSVKVNNISCEHLPTLLDSDATATVVSTLQARSSEAKPSSDPVLLRVEETQGKFCGHGSQSVDKLVQDFYLEELHLLASQPGDDLTHESNVCCLGEQSGGECDNVPDMNSYSLSRKMDTSSNRHSRTIGGLVEHMGPNLLKAHNHVEDRSCSPSHIRVTVDAFPPEIPQRIPLDNVEESSTSFSGPDSPGSAVNIHQPLFLHQSGKVTQDIELDYNESITSFVQSEDPVCTINIHNQTEVDTNRDLSLRAKKRHSSTPNYENWTINRAITVPSSDRDFCSVSDDDELDDLSTSPAAAGPNVDQPDYSSGSKDSGLCDDISVPDITSTDPSSSKPHQDHRFAVLIKQNDQLFSGNICLDHEEHHDVVQDGALTSDSVDQRSVRRDDDLAESLSVDRLSVDTVSMGSDGDEETASTNMDSSYDETDSARDGMLKMRQLLVKGVLDSEKSYLTLLSLLVQYKKNLEFSAKSSQPLISLDDVQTIFSSIEMVHEIQTEFVSSLEAKVTNWSHTEKIGEIFKIMIFKLVEYGNYLNNYQQAVTTIHKCCQESEQFDKLAKQIMVSTNGETSKEMTTLEDALFKPVQRVQRNTLLLLDLIKYTPQDHPDYPDLLKAHKLSLEIIEGFAKAIPRTTNTQESRRLAKSSFLVEDVGGVRKLRYIFLFSDVLVCTKRETHRNNKVTFGIKWFAPLGNTNIETRFLYTEDNKSSKKDDIGELKRRLKEQKKELKSEIRKSDDRDKHRSLVSLGGGAARNVEKLKKKVNQTEAQLILSSPKLPFKVMIEGGRSYTLLMSTDYEREEWKETIASLSKKCSRMDQAHHFSSINIQELVNSVKETPQVNKIGNVLLQKDEDVLTGVLNVTIHNVSGLTDACDTYCIMEMDSFGHFFLKGRTNICERTKEPTWSDSYDLELEGSETLRILCFRKDESNHHGDTLLGKVSLELSKHWLKESFQEKTLSDATNGISFVISVRHIAADKTMQRTPSRTNSAVFGVSIASCTKRDGKTVPSFVTACIQEVEKRGIEEVGIYRVSGVSSELQTIKKLTDKNVRMGILTLQDVDIHSVTGVLKLYLRELPEPLFTEANYHSFIDTLKLADVEAKTQCMLALLHGLPDPNYYTIVYLLDHLIKVAKSVGTNKMSINNLSTIFGPTLLAPASKQISNDPLENMCRGAEEVMLQSSVVNFLLGLAFMGRSLRRSAQ